MEFFRWMLIFTGASLLGIAYLMGRKTLQPSVYHRDKPDAYDPSIDELRMPIADPVTDLVTDDWQDTGITQSESEAYQDETAVDSDTAPLNYQVDESFLTDEEIDAALPANESYGLDPVQVEIDMRDDIEEDDLIIDATPPGLDIDDQIHDAQARDVPAASFASVVRRASSEADEQRFSEELEAYSEPVQLDGFEEKLVTVHVAASADKLFSGRDLKSLFDKHGYKFGRMSLYHCTLEGDKVFSIANMVKPGTFDEQEMDAFETPGFTLFMRLPIKLNADVAFDFLIREATELAEELDGQLRDVSRNPLSEQTIQHMREDIQQYVFRTKQSMRDI